MYNMKRATSPVYTERKVDKDNKKKKNKGSFFGILSSRDKDGGEKAMETGSG